MSQYISNIWYAAAWAEEVGKAPLRRVLLDKAVMFFRDDEGAVVALRDRCPHRFAPLSLGEVTGDKIICAYHGLTFDRSGHCVASAFSAQPPKVSVQSYPVIERDQMVWFWPGDPDLADPSTIPSLSYQADMPGRRTLRGYTPMKANYLLGSDNLMDLSHIEFIHTGTFAGNGVIFAGQHQIRQEGETLESNWWMPNVPTPDWARTQYAHLGDPVDHWLDMVWRAPGVMRLAVGFCEAGSEREQGIEQFQAHIVTPETARSSHYFWSTTRYNDVESEELDAVIRARLSAAFNDEDKPIMEAVQRELGDEDFWAAKPYYLGIDGGGVRVRREIEAIINKERAT